MKRALCAAAAVACALVVSTAASAADWTSSVAFTNQVASTPFKGGGYPVPPGANAPLPGTCRLGDYNSNESESWIAVKPGTEDLVGSSKFFFENFSTFYDFHLGSYTMPNGTSAGTNQVQGYDCVSTGTGGQLNQNMPPSWTNNTDPNVDFDTQGRAYQVTLPFNAYWVNLHPNSNIAISYSDDLGRHWIKGNGGEPLEHAPNWSSLSFGFVEDKQWVAVNHIPGNRYQDHVYAAWTVYNGNTSKLRVAVSRDRGQTFSKAVTITAPNQTGPLNEYIYPSIDADGIVYVAFTSNGVIYVSKSEDDGVTWSPFVEAATAGLIPTAGLPNTRFRDGIVQNFAASPTYGGHLYLTYEDWDSATGQFDVKFVQSTDGGLTWSEAVQVNDADTQTDQFQPSVAAGAGGAVAIAFYDRRQACPSDSSVLPADRGRTNFCIDTSLQAYKDSGAGAVAVGGNVRISQFTWDPEQPGQKVGGLSQYPCAGHSDPCASGRGFIGDYFGLAISGTNVYGFFVSTHYPSATVSADGGGAVYYQDQVLATVARSALGL
jgi:hypothetical protein